MCRPACRPSKQVVGAILGSSFLFATVPNSGASALGSNAIAPGETRWAGSASRVVERAARLQAHAGLARQSGLATAAARRRTS